MGGVAGIFPATATAGALLPSLLRRQPRSTLSFYSVSASASEASSSSRLAPDHVTFIKEVATTRPPESLSCLLNILRARGDSIVSPGAKHGMIPLAITMSENESGTITALLRWPTAPPGYAVHIVTLVDLRMDMPVVEVHRHGVWLAKTVDQYIQRLLAEEDAAKTGIDSSQLTETSSRIAESLYKSGDFKGSQYPSLDVYLLKKEVAKIAEWEDEQVEYIKERVTEEGKLVDLKKGKEPAQVALDEAAFLLDLASVEGTWSDVVEQVADNYKEAGLDDIARFILYGD